MTSAAVYNIKPDIDCPRTIFIITVPAGTPEIVGEYPEGYLDLTAELVTPSTFAVRVKGESMQDAGISSGDLLLVDRQLQPMSQSIVLVMVNDELTIKRISRSNGRLWLVPANALLVPCEVNKNDSCAIWGVVTYIIHRA